MTEEEIDAWYEDEKQRIMEEYLNEITKSKDHEKAQREHTAKLDILINKYTKMIEKNKKREIKADRMKRVFNSIKERIFFIKQK